MNIKQFFPTTAELPTLTRPLAGDVEVMLASRKHVFDGFAKKEAQKGFVRSQVSLSTTQGQEMMRIMFFRVLEEAAESYMSTDPDHIKEEIIDSVNYLLSIPLMDEKLFSRDRLTKVLIKSAEDAFNDHRTSEPLTQQDLGFFTFRVCGELADTFRNRAWMDNPQDLYFSGDQKFLQVMGLLLFRMFRVFESWDEFVRFFWAKDRVLRFRLESSY